MDTIELHRRAVEGFVQDQVSSFIASDRFANLWEGAIRVAHEAASRLLRGDSEVVVAEDGQITLNLIPIVNAVLAQITSASPEILGREVDIPDFTRGQWKTIPPLDIVHM